MKKFCPGFTLVELLVIIIVLAVLMGLSVRTFTFITDRARETATEAEMGNITKALQIYVAVTDTYPAEGDFPDALQVAGIMERPPKMDKWENLYQYSSIAGIFYTLESYGMDETDGGDDDIVFTNGIMVEDGAFPN